MKPFVAVQWDHGRFLEAMAEVLRRPVEELGGGIRPLGELELDEVDLFRMASRIEQVNPYFRMPDQLDLEDSTVDDWHHFACIIGHGHVEVRP